LREKVSRGYQAAVTRYTAVYGGEPDLWEGKNRYFFFDNPRKR